MNYLTTTEINDLKAIRATYIVDADLTEIRDFFKKYGISFTNDKGINTERVYKIVFNNYDSSRNLNGFTDAKILKVYTIAKTMDLSDCIKAVTDKAFLYQHEYCFELDLPAKLTTLRRFILTTLRRCNLTTYSLEFLERLSPCLD